MKSKSGQRMLALVLALVLMIPTTLSGCMFGNQGDSQSRGSAENNAALAAALQERYSDSQKVNYAPGENAIERDHQFVIEVEFDALEMGIERFSDIAGIYYDADLTQRAISNFAWDNEELTSYTISPREFCDLAIGSSNKPERFPYGFENGSYWLFDRGAFSDWGNIATLYLATKRDLKTGEVLEKPIVQVYTVKGELDTPDLTVEVSDDGLVQFSWNEIKGAKIYYIIRLDYYEEGSSPTPFLLDSTTETQWNSRGLFSEGSDLNDSTANKDFTTFMISEDDWLNPYTVAAYEGEYDPADGAVTKESYERRKFCVIAVNELGTSMFSRFADIKDVASIAPFGLADNMNRSTEEGFSRYAEGIDKMPCYAWIVLCNGTLAQRLVIYDFSEAKEETEKRLYTEQNYENVFDIDDWEMIYVDFIMVPYQIEGTSFVGTLRIHDYDTNNITGQLEVIKARQEALQTKTGNVKRGIELEDEDGADPIDVTGDDGIVIGDTAVTANSALSEYLALSMLSGVKSVDLSLFPESLDKEYLLNAWSEAFYQNPLILGVSRAQVSRDGQTLYLEYEDDAETRERKQTEIKDEVARVASAIINSSMSARDKEFAINQYLCDTVEYDEAALANGESYGFTKVDDEFLDSFTAYGALINGVGVCASYAAAFKLLADAAGLDCVVVTGYLDGSLGHAWNRVDLGGGRWATVDATNNDSELIANAILNVPDYAIATSLVEDGMWVMSSVISEYSNNDDADEYYRVEGMFFAEDEVVGQIVAQLATSDIAIIRTDYMLSEAQFVSYCEEVLQAVEKDIAGLYWAGVIVITTNPARFF